MTEICQDLHNFFVCSRHTGTFEIQDGSLSVPGLKPGSYFLISGSVFNDGVHKCPAEDLDDEKFDGVVALMAPPSDFIRLVADIEAWRAKYEAAGQSPFTAETFGGYRYRKDNRAVSWKTTFAERLKQYRKL